MSKGIKKARENPFFRREKSVDELASPFSKSVLVKDYPLALLNHTGPSDKHDIQDVQTYVVRRVVENVLETGNPMHRLAATDVVVDTDSTLEAAIARLSAGIEVVPAIEDYYVQHREVLDKVPPIEVIHLAKGQHMRDFHYAKVLREIRDAANAADVAADVVD
jgi:hypothetical protein